MELEERTLYRPTLETLIYLYIRRKRKKKYHHAHTEHTKTHTEHAKTTRRHLNLLASFVILLLYFSSDFQQQQQKSFCSLLRGSIKRRNSYRLSVFYLREDFDAIQHIFRCLLASTGTTEWLPFAIRFTQRHTRLENTAHTQICIYIYSTRQYDDEATKRREKKNSCIK